MLLEKAKYTGRSGGVKQSSVWCVGSAYSTVACTSLPSFHSSDPPPPQATMLFRSAVRIIAIRSNRRMYVCTREGQALCVRARCLRVIDGYVQYHSSTTRQRQWEEAARKRTTTARESKAYCEYYGVYSMVLAACIRGTAGAPPGSVDRRAPYLHYLRLVSL
jgi:hypothetical protein